MGYHLAAMMKLLLVLLAFQAIEGHMTEPDTYALSVPPPPGEEDTLSLIQEDVQETAVTKYRVTWQTKMDECAKADKRKCSNVRSKFQVCLQWKLQALNHRQIRHSGARNFQSPRGEETVKRPVEKTTGNGAEC